MNPLLAHCQPRTALQPAAVFLLLFCLALLPAAEAAAQPAAAPAATDQLDENLVQILGLTPSSARLGVKEIQDAVAAFQARQFDDALKKLDDARKKNAELPPGRLLLSRLLFAANEVNAARLLLEQVIVEDPTVPEAYLLFGNLALAERRVTDAALQFDKAVLLAGAQANWSEERRQSFLRQCYAGQATVAQQRGKWGEAVAAIRIWLRMDDQDAQAHQRLAQALFFEKDKPDETEVLKELQRAKQLNDQLEQPEVTMGWYYTQKGEPNEAEKWMLASANKYPDEAGVRTAAATWFLMQGRVEEAQVHAKKAQELDKDSDALKRLNGLIAYRQRRFADAEAIFNDLRSKSPGEFFPTNYLALAMIESDSPDKRRLAVEYAELNFRGNQNSPDAAATLGWLYYRVGRTNEALQLLNALVQNRQATPDAAYYLARVLIDAGKFNEAGGLLRQALAAGPNFNYRKEAESYLRNLQSLGGSGTLPSGGGETLAPSVTTPPKPPEDGNKATSPPEQN